MPVSRREAVSPPAASARGGRLKIRPVALAFLTLLMTVSCGSRADGLKPPIWRNVAERAPVGLRVDVVNFNWQYIRDGGGLQVSGTVKNNSGRDQRVVLYCMLFDEGGKAVGMGEARVSPLLLPAGGLGSFTLTAATSRPRQPRPIRHMRLLTNAQNN
jgi:hypothetical protein